MIVSVWLKCSDILFNITSLFELKLCRIIYENGTWNSSITLYSMSSTGGAVVTLLVW